VPRPEESIASTPSIARRSGNMVTASGLRFAAMLEVFGFLGFFEVGIIRQFPSSWEWQGQTSVDDEHEGAKPFPHHRQTSLQSKP
jgi:hypothetical protein